MKLDHKVLIYYHKPEYVDKYCQLIKREEPYVKVFPCKNESEIDNYIEEVEIIFSGHTFPVSFLKKASKLKWIQSMSAGVENYIESNLIPEDVFLTKIKGVFGPIMAEYVIGKILYITQKFSKAYNDQKNKKWDPYVVDSIRDKVIGIMGLGSVGSYIAYQIHFLCNNIIALEEQEKNISFINKIYDISEIAIFLEKCDFIIITIPLTNKTRGLIGIEMLNKIKKSAYIINISRGPIIDEVALIKALKNKRIGGAILDVFNKEPLPVDNNLWDLDNVIITPHISGPSLPEDIVKLFLENLRRFDRGEQLINLVDKKKGY